MIIIVIAAILYALLLIAAACAGIIMWAIFFSWWLPAECTREVAVFFALTFAIALHVKFVRQTDVETIFKS